VARKAIGICARTSDRAAIKTVRPSEIADPQMHSSDAKTVGRIGVIADMGIGEREQIVDVEIVGGRKDRAHGKLQRQHVENQPDRDVAAEIPCPEKPRHRLG
jgi:hypothetical protein